jgi:hypothetical protein
MDKQLEERLRGLEEQLKRFVDAMEQPREAKIYGTD